ncbi:MAG: pitrilysin family protein [Bdellovibrionota bacterium]
MSGKKIRRTVLDNGLTILGESNPANKSAALGFFVKTGSRDEVGPEAGISHFLEHMMFKGSHRRSAEEVMQHLGDIGAQANAYTSEARTVYYASVIPEYFTDLQEIYSDMLRPTLAQKEFDTEKNVILEEIAVYEDRPIFHLFEKSLQHYFQDHPAGNSVLGTTESVTGITREMMVDYFDRRYSPSNIVLAAAGNFDWDEYVAKAEELCGSWDTREAGRETPIHNSRELTQTFYKKELQQSHLLFVTEGASSQELERYSLSTLAVILGDSSGSKLYWDLVDKGIAESASCEHEDRDGTGIVGVYASTEPAKVDEVSEIIKRVLSEKRNYTSEDLERAKTKICTKVVLGGELPFGRLMALGTGWLAREEVLPLNEIVERIQAVTNETIDAALEKYPLDTWAEYRLLPE